MFTTNIYSISYTKNKCIVTIFARMDANFLRFHVKGKRNYDQLL